MNLLQQRVVKLIVLTRTLFLGASIGLFPSFLEGAEAPLVVVLSSNSGPYKEAFQGFQEAFGQTVPVLVMTQGDPQVPRHTRVIVAIGGKAALYPNYPPNARLIYALAPGIRI